MFDCCYGDLFMKWHVYFMADAKGLKALKNFRE